MSLFENAEVAELVEPRHERESYKQIAAELRASRGAARPSREAIATRSAESTLAAMRAKSTTTVKGHQSAARWFALAAEEELCEKSET